MFLWLSDKKSESMARRQISDKPLSELMKILYYWGIHTSVGLDELDYSAE